MASTSGQEEFLAVIRKSQEAVIAAVTNLAETVRTASPKLASVYAPLTDNLPRPLVRQRAFRGPDSQARGRRSQRLRLRRAVACQPAEVRR